MEILQWIVTHSRIDGTEAYEAATFGSYTAALVECRELRASFGGRAFVSSRWTGIPDGQDNETVWAPLPPILTHSRV